MSPEHTMDSAVDQAVTHSKVEVLDHANVRTDSMRLTIVGENCFRTESGPIYVNQFSPGHSQRETDLREREDSLQKWENSLKQRETRMKMIMDIAENDRHDIEKRLQDMAVKEQYIARALEQLLGRSNQLEAREADLMHREEDYQRREGDFEDKMKSLNERARILSRQEDEFWKRDEDWRQLQASGNMITYPAEATAGLMDVFGFPEAQGIEFIVQQFNFSEISCPGSRATEARLLVRLAPFYSRLKKGSLDEFQDSVKIAICATLRMVEMERASRKLTWDNLTLLFTQAAHLRSYGEADVSSDEVQVVRGAVYDSRFLQEWIKALLYRENVHEATAHILSNQACGLERARRGKHQSSRLSKSTRRLVDITFLRFPDTTSQCFKLCRAIVEQWTLSKSVLGLPSSNTHFIATYTTRTFLVRDRLIYGMSSDIQEYALKSLASLFKG